MIPNDLFHIILVIPILNVLTVFYKIFTTLHVPWAFGFSIVALTATIRLILHPLFHQQMQTTKKMNDMKPHLDRLSLKHKDDPKKLQAEQMNLYKEAGINPASGCLSLIIQMPIFIGLYSTLTLILSKGTGNALITSINKVVYSPFLHITGTIDPYFFMYNLALTPAQSGSWYYYLVPVVTGFLQYLQFQATMQKPADDKDVKDIEKKKDEKDGKEVKKDTSGDFQKAMNTQMKYIFPVMIAYFSYTLPIGLSLYWNIFSLFSIIQYKAHNAKEKVQESKNKGK